MADILIRGIEMPQRCKACRFCGFGGRRSELNVCMFTGESQPKLSQERMSKCPLVPVPPHGRLIDADALQAKFELMENAFAEHGRPYSFAFKDGGEMCAEWWTVQDALSREPTIVPAEGGTDECSEN